MKAAKISYHEEALAWFTFTSIPKSFDLLFPQLAIACTVEEYFT